MTKITSATLVALATFLLGTQFVSAQNAQGSFWLLTSGALKPVSASWGLWVPGLATSTTGCLSVNSSGWVSASGSACGAGTGGDDPFTHPALGESATTTRFLINSASSTVTNLFVVNGTTTNATSTNISTTVASTSNLILSGTNGSLLATSMIGKVGATTTIGWNLLKGAASTLFAFDPSGNPYGAASSTLYGTGSPGQVLMWSGLVGAPVWAATSSVPGGSDTQVQFNDGGTFNGDTALVWDKTNNYLSLGADTTIAGILRLYPGAGGNWTWISNSNAGDIRFSFGATPSINPTFTITDGFTVQVHNSSNISAILQPSSLSSTDKTFTFPNQTGTFCLVDFNCTSTSSAHTWTALQTFKAASTTDFTATRATSTNMEITGNLRHPSLTSAILLTDANGLFAEYAGASACTNQFVTALSALGGTTCASINNAQWSGTDLAVANGGTGLSTFGGTNTILFTTAADTLASNAALTFSNVGNTLFTTTNATTTNLSATSFWFANATGTNAISTATASTSNLFLSGCNGCLLGTSMIGKVAATTTVGWNYLATVAANSVMGNSTGAAATPTSVATSSLFTWSPAFSTTGTVKNIVEKSFTIATTTTWSGTTTIPIFQSILASTINGVRCKTYLATGAPGGTFNVHIGKWSASTTMFNASSTNNFMAFTTNNTVAAGDSWYADIGTVGSSGTKLNCTVQMTI